MYQNLLERENYKTTKTILKHLEEYIDLLESLNLIGLNEIQGVTGGHI